MAIGSKFERVDLQSFAPDMRPDSPQILIDSNGVYPTAKGYRTLPALVEAMPAPDGTGAAGWVYGAFYARYLDNTSKVIVGTNDNLWVADPAAKTWAEKSKTTDGYNVETNERWRFAQFGNDTLAVNGNNAPQFVNETDSDFADLAGSPPIARHIAVANNFVFLANIKPSTGVDENTWWCSGIGNDADWTPDASTQSANGRVLDTPGPITACRALGRNIVVYKNRSCYLFEYVGPPVIWANQILSQSAGAWGGEAVIDTGGAHYWMGFDDFYMYDGSGAPRSVPNPVREYIFERGDLDKTNAHAVVGRWDRETDVLFWHYPSTALTQDADQVILDRWVGFNRGTERWAIGSISISCAVLPEYGDQPGVTYDGASSIFSTWGGGDSSLIWADSIFGGGASVLQAVFAPTSNKLFTFSGGASANTFLRGGYWGDGIHDRTVRRFRPIMSRYPTSAAGASIKVYTKKILGGNERLADEQDINHDEGWFDVQVDDRYVSPRFEFSEDLEIIGYDLEYEEETGET